MPSHQPTDSSSKCQPPANAASGLLVTPAGGHTGMPVGNTCPRMVGDGCGRGRAAWDGVASLGGLLAAQRGAGLPPSAGVLGAAGTGGHGGGRLPSRLVPESRGALPWPAAMHLQESCGALPWPAAMHLHTRCPLLSSCSCTKLSTARGDF
ncbi:hypothetical protein SEVIR_4G122300v4 [Setaria viridis]|uniref:Uncharacterized protein n=1 Tax=Setaria viridis TaxID=4556 RepID=A0A4U6UXV2_SETVI|nr:hypothetical protein SEVIR_4G122300v2 [Setaria viridis]